jgi:uncharacterized protein YggE
MTEIASTANTITVSGQGTVTAAPDYFHINVGIEAQRPTVKEAYAAAGTALNAVQARLLARNVARDAISSSTLDVRVESRWQDGVGSLVTGYTVSSTLNVMLRYDEAAEDTIAAVVDTGNDSVRLNGLTPAMSDPAAAQDAARALAWANARSAADLYAQLAGKTVGGVVSISEGQPHTPGPAPIMARAMMATEASMVIEPGQSGVSAAVTVTWQLL